jgi:hypothetical protein
LGSRCPKVRVVRSDAGQPHRSAQRRAIAAERLDFDVGSAGRKASVQRAHLGVDFGEPRKRLGDGTRGPGVVADDQLSRFLGELLRSREIGGELSVKDCYVEAFKLAPGMLISRRAVSCFAPEMLPVCRSARGEPVRL